LARYYLSREPLLREDVSSRISPNAKALFTIVGASAFLSKDIALERERERERERGEGIWRNGQLEAESENAKRKRGPFDSGKFRRACLDLSVMCCIIPLTGSEGGATRKGKREKEGTEEPRARPRARAPDERREERKTKFREQEVARVKRKAPVARPRTSGRLERRERSGVVGQVAAATSLEARALALSRREGEGGYLLFRLRE